MKSILFVLAALVSLSTLAEENSKAPVWQLQTEQGQVVKSSDFKDKPLIIHFWATWCPYCKKLQPGLDRLYSKYQKDGLQLISISIREDEGAKPQSVLDARGLNLKTVINGEKVAEQFGVPGTPTTIFIDKKGNIIAQTQSSDPDDPRLEQVVKYLVTN